MPPAGYPAFLQYLQSGRVRKLPAGDANPGFPWSRKGLTRDSCRCYPVGDGPGAAGRVSLPRRSALQPHFMARNMPSFTHHIFVCGNVRDPGHKRRCCDPAGLQTLRDAFKLELRKAGFGSLARANHAGCLDQCEHGPNVVIYPQGIWYGRVTTEDVPRIVSKTILGGEILNDLLIPESCLNNPNCPHRS